LVVEDGCGKVGNGLRGKKENCADQVFALYSEDRNGEKLGYAQKIICKRKDGARRPRLS